MSHDSSPATNRQQMGGIDRQIDRHTNKSWSIETDNETASDNGTTGENKKETNRGKTGVNKCPVSLTRPKTGKTDS